MTEIFSPVLFPPGACPGPGGTSRQEAPGPARNAQAVSHDHEALMTGLFDLVWADDVVTPNEVHALTTVLLKLGYSLPDVICMLDRKLAAPPAARTSLPLDQTFARRPPSEDELRLLLAICFSDGAIQPEQVGYIEGLILRWGLRADDLERLRQEATGAL